MCLLLPGREDPLEKEMATHCSILAWEIPFTEGLVGYSPWGGKESDMTERLKHQAPVTGKSQGAEQVHGGLGVGKAETFKCSQKTGNTALANLSF